MREKARDLVYLNSQNYLSIDTLRIFYWGIILIPIFMVVIGFAAINTIGVHWKSLFPLVTIAIWSLLYWIFVLTIQSKKVKKTFELRFIVNGISGLFMSSLFWILYASISLFYNSPIFSFEFSLLILFFYVLFSVFYIVSVILNVHKGLYKKGKKKGQTPKALSASIFFSAILPVTGIFGMYTSKILRSYASVIVEDVVVTIGFVLLIFLPSLAQINFVQYYYCKKYKILCDEHGNTTSPMLEPQVKEKIKAQKIKAKKETNTSSSKKKIPLIIKILIGIVSAPVVLVNIAFIVFIIKELIQ